MIKFVLQDFLFKNQRFYPSAFYNWDEYDLANTEQNQLYYVPKHDE